MNKCSNCGELVGLGEWHTCKRLSDKKKKDTGGGCSICGNNPAVNVEGTYWLCGACVNEFYVRRKGVIKELKDKPTT